MAALKATVEQLQTDKNDLRNVIELSRTSFEEINGQLQTAVAEKNSFEIINSSLTGEIELVRTQLGETESRIRFENLKFIELQWWTFNGF
jgi:predicted nuclease with TOPRIM domain